MAFIDGMQATIHVGDGFSVTAGEKGWEDVLAVCNSDDYENGVLIGLHAGNKEGVVLVVSTDMARRIGQEFITYADEMDARLAAWKQEAS